MLILGEAGCGKSTLANRILGISDKFETGHKVGPVTRFDVFTCTALYQVIDASGLFGSKSDMKKQMRRLKSFCCDFCRCEINCILFVRAIGPFTSSEKDMFDMIKGELDTKAQSISALVITKCEDLDEEERRKYKADFMSDKRTIETAQFMDRGIHLVGFPNSKNIQELLKEQIEMDETTVRNLLLECSDELPVKDIFNKMWYNNIILS